MPKVDGSAGCISGVTRVAPGQFQTIGPVLAASSADGDSSMTSERMQSSSQCCIGGWFFLQGVLRAASDVCEGASNQEGLLSTSVCGRWRVPTAAASAAEGGNNTAGGESIGKQRECKSRNLPAAGMHTSTLTSSTGLWLQLPPGIWSDLE